MRPQGMRRLATDISALHTKELPPNYLLSPDDEEQDDLTQLDILLAGPSHTPFSEGVWRLHLSIPAAYPAEPPSANFRTSIFHPNVHPDTGGVCVETLKRDWDSKLTLRDVLITISCLLIQPNPDSALNAEAGSLIQEDFELFARKARLMTSIHASVPAHLSAAVLQARTRGQEQSSETRTIQAPPVRQRRPMTRARQRGKSRHSDGSPISSLVNRRHQNATVHDDQDDLFRTPQSPTKINSDDLMSSADQENLSLLEAPIASASTPRRPPGPPIPLGELIMSSDSDDDYDMEPEYPPSPRKSPSKSPAKRHLDPLTHSNLPRLESDSTPPNLTDKPMHSFTPFACSIPRLAPQRHNLERQDGISKAVGNHVNAERLWSLCGEDISRWNRGDFDQQPFPMVAPRW